MKIFDDFGKSVEKLWVDKNYNEDLFPEVAAKALRQANLPKKVNAWKVMEWTLGQTQIPDQKDLPGRFGEPPITVYSSPRFHVDVYFWLSSTTSIHQHGFCGAFQVLEGSSIHSQYDFDTSEKINTFMEIGDIKLRKCELLNVGDVHVIPPGRQFIHSLFHLDQPSVTICVRTHKSPLHPPQFDYKKPYIAMDPFFSDENLTKKMQCINTMIMAKHKGTDNAISKMIRNSDFQTTFSIFLQLSGYLQQGNLEKLFDLQSPNERHARFMKVAKKRHGKRIDLFPKVFAHFAFQNDISQRRHFVADYEQRFFMALLLNVEGKKNIFAFVKQRYPDAKPLDKVLDWVFDLSQMRVVGMAVPNALGIVDFDDFDLFLLENLLKNKTQMDIKKGLKKEFPSDKVAEFRKSVKARTEKLTKAVILRPLFK